MSKEYLEALDWLEEKCYVESPQAEKFEECCKIIRQSLQRLESIDNANPSEALKCLEKLELLTCDFEWYKDNINTIKQALLKAQKPKKYLKWEDLEFNIEKQMMAVLLNGTKYTLILGRNVHIDKLAFLRNGEINYYFLEAGKQFFNDLHLERVEE